MDISEYNTDMTIRAAKRNCLLCHARKSIKNKDDEKAKAVDGVLELQNFYAELHNRMRRDDSSSAEMNLAIENKMTCRDVMDECKTCDKSVDCINRGLTRIK
ncbi:MAG: hypothetical protein AABW72_01180 [archaeon]